MCPISTHLYNLSQAGQGPDLGGIASGKQVSTQNREQREGHAEIFKNHEITGKTLCVQRK